MKTRNAGKESRGKAEKEEKTTQIRLILKTKREITLFVK